jgi:hypothetical protein
VVVRVGASRVRLALTGFAGMSRHGVTESMRSSPCQDRFLTVRTIETAIAR